MRRLAIVFLSCAAAAAVSQTYRGVATVASGYVVDAEGNRIPVAGTKLPFVAERIQAAPEMPFPFASARRAGLSTSDVTGYKNDNGAGSYFYSGLAMPSALDDVMMAAAGVGGRWQHVSMGINAETEDEFEVFIIRWIAWRTYTSGLGHGVQAFSNLAFDVGTSFSFGLYGMSVPGTYRITFDFTPLNINAPQQQIYFAQQFREYDTSGNGAFLPYYSTVFSRGNPTIGSSLDQFWYDSDPEDGIYADDELEQFDPGNEANFLLQVETVSSGTVETRQPVTVATGPGVVLSGDIFSVLDSDNSYYVARPGVVLVSSADPLAIQFDSTTSTTPIVAYSFQIEAKGSTGTLTQKIDLYNWSTTQWVQVDSRPAPTTDTVVTVNAPGSANEFVQNGTRRIRARVRYRATGAVLVYPWTASVDQALWRITIP
jgi:hypothetical protein